MDEYKWYSGKYDRVFKEVMLKESNRDLLTMLLEHILKVKINNITILNNEKLVCNIHIRSQKLDLNLDTNIGKINVEVNSSYKKITPSRNFSYLADIYSHDILVGKEYDLDKKYIQINLSYGLNNNIEAIDIYKIRNDKGNTYIDNFIIYSINMDYYINLFNTNDKKKIKDDIILVMLGQERNNLIKLAKTNKVVSKYMNELDEVNKNPEFREYMSYELEQEILRNSERKLGFKEGIEQGTEQTKKLIIDSLLASGMSKEEIEKRLNINLESREYMSKEEDDRKIRNTLIKEADENGFNRGIEQSKKEIVNNLLNTNMSISDISKIVNLPEEEIIKIKDAK